MIAMRATGSFRDACGVRLTSAARRRLGCLALLLSIAPLGCSVLYPTWHACRNIVGQPLQAGIHVMGAPRQVSSLFATHTVRDQAQVSLFEGGGAQLYVWAPAGVFGSNERRRCEHLGRDEHDEWVDLAGRLAAYLGERVSESGEVISASRDGTTSWRATLVSALDPPSLEAARIFACLAAESFGEDGEEAIARGAPELASMIDFPAVCASEDAIRR